MNVSDLVNKTLFEITSDDRGSSPFASINFEDPLTIIEVFVLGLMIVLTIGGNLLVIAAVVSSASLRTPTHSLIVNLAVADLLLGITVLPLSAIREVSNGVWAMGANLCSVWTTLDVLCCTASILSLCGISVDRYIGVSRPLSYSRILTKGRARCLVVVIWTLALAISIAPPLGWRDDSNDVVNDGQCHVNTQLGYVIFSACGSFYIPATVIIVLYFLVYRAAVKHSKFLLAGTRVTNSDVTLRAHMGNATRSRSSSCNQPLPQTEPSNTNCSDRKSLHLTATNCGGSATHLLLTSTTTSQGQYLQPPMEPTSPSWSMTSEQGRRLTAAGVYGRLAKFRRQQKAAKTLGIVVGGFLLCWFPFFLLLPIDAACESCDIHVPFNFAFWLGYFNSCINPFIYACSSRELRRAFRSILCRRIRNAASRDSGDDMAGNRRFSAASMSRYSTAAAYTGVNQTNSNSVVISLCRSAPNERS